MIHSNTHINLTAAHHMSKVNPGEKTRQQIDENLKRVFQEQVEEQLPDRFKDLLAQLKKQDVQKDQCESQ